MIPCIHIAYSITATPCLFLLSITFDNLVQAEARRVGSPACGTSLKQVYWSCSSSSNKFLHSCETDPVNNTPQYHFGRPHRPRQLQIFCISIFIISICVTKLARENPMYPLWRQYPDLTTSVAKPDMMSEHFRLKGSSLAVSSKHGCI